MKRRVKPAVRRTLGSSNAVTLSWRVLETIRIMYRFGSHSRHEFDRIFRFDIRLIGAKRIRLRSEDLLYSNVSIPVDNERVRKHGTRGRKEVLLVG